MAMTYKAFDRGKERGRAGVKSFTEMSTEAWKRVIRANAILPDWS